MSAPCEHPIPAANGSQLRNSVNRLADLAYAIDHLKSTLPDSAQRDRLTHAVEEAHEAAMYYDGLHSFGIYAGDLP